jgi:glycosyltransferase involved in cell wall biosynthesis
MKSFSVKQRRRVCIVQRRLTHYRIPLFEMLRRSLAEHGVELTLLVGKGTLNEERKRDTGILDWAKEIPTRYFFEGRICWQPIRVVNTDLVIVTQENKLVYNHFLLFKSRRPKLAFWGHGANMQATDNRSLKEKFKKWTTGKADWWFAYTKISAEFIVQAGYPQERISVLNNSVDTSELDRHLRSVMDMEKVTVRRSLGLGNGRVGIFIGSLYSDKRLDFLFAAADAIRHALPDFHLLILGDGPQRDTVELWCSARPWAHWLGACFGRDKAVYMSLADVMLNPGLVGLGILDAFIGGIPIITTDCKIHSPEIAYLENQRNGIMTANDLMAYVESCVGLLTNTKSLEALRAGCLTSAQKYTLENMAANFSDGIMRCLETYSFSGRGAA